MKAPFGGTSGNLNADKRYSYALQLSQDGDFQGAADLLSDALCMAPMWPPLHFHLGDMLHRLHNAEASETAYRHYLQLDPYDHMGAGVKLALMGKSSETVMSAAYVQSLFDQYAPRFESSLVGKLEYRLPDIIAEMLPRAHYKDVLDLGCGTGLVAEALRGKFDRITGVDLSPSMIEEAAKKNRYSDLHVCSIAEYFNKSHATFDLIAAADVLIYLAKLNDVFNNMGSALNKGGHFVLSVQGCNGNEYVLGDDHRYAHSLPYVQSCADQAGLNIQTTKQVVIRQDAGHPFQGWLILCEKPA